MNQIDLRSRVAVVTGGASGLGLATARRLRDSGADIWIWDLEAGALACAEEALGLRPQERTVALDVSDPQAVERAAETVRTGSGRIDILFNCAGISIASAPAADISVEDWQRVMAVNLSGTFYTCRAVVPIMVRQKYGRIVTVSSIAGKEGNALQSAYSASKAGIIGFTKSLGKELAATGVVVNCMAPSVFDTPMHRSTRDENPHLMAGILQRIPMNRIGEVEEFAAMAAWLVSEECSFTTGFVFDLSGGRATY